MIDSTIKQRVRLRAVFALALAAVVCAAGAYAANDNKTAPYVRIGLLYGSSAVDEVRIESEHGFFLMQENSGDLEFIRSLEAYHTLFVTRNNRRIEVRDEGGVVLSDDFASDSVLVSAAEDPEDRILSIGSAGYRDGVCFARDASGGLTVINYVGLEHYLCGVLSREMSPSYPLEALKAQAVAARSFAIGTLGRHAGLGFDLCNKTCCQVYSGVDAEYESTTQACQETEGYVLAYDGELAVGYYHASSGGYTQNSEDVWVSAVPYLRAVKDEFAPLGPWHTQLTFEELKRRLEASSYDPGTIRSVQIEQRFQNDSVAQLRIEGSRNTIVLAKEKVRTVLGADVIRTVRFSMGASPSPALDIEAGGAGISLHSNLGRTTASGTLSVVAAGAEPVQISSQHLSIWNGRTLASAPEASGTSIRFTEETVTGGTVYFQGLGHGHGVGMPQTSAREMARSGYGYREILTYYYTGIDIVQADRLSGDLR